MSPATIVAQPGDRPGLSEERINHLLGCLERLQQQLTQLGLSLEERRQLGKELRDIRSQLATH